ncbi:hypothetical protein PIB30_003551 [Stylosanthes scabra]|uniref:Uncharacterized protein n=1 Tax=Stylosanthes scabra TaxID=79078 RepID=A0ABU6X553_9FABA|nr:hypothetical protein [Stylosanthes scabra]
MASLSMNSQNIVPAREDPEVPITSTITTLAPKLNLLNGVNNTETAKDLVFTTTAEASHSTSSRLSLKKQARAKFKRIAGVKRNPIGVSENQLCKKLCAETKQPTEEGEGATPQWAPNDS